MVLARNAYKAVECHRSQADYETEVVADAANGIDIGDKNHSRMFTAEMTDHFYTVQDTRLNYYLKSERGQGTGSIVF